MRPCGLLPLLRTFETKSSRISEVQNKYQNITLWLGKKKCKLHKITNERLFFFFFNEQVVLCFLLKINTTQNEEIIILYPEDTLDIKHHYVTIEYQQKGNCTFYQSNCTEPRRYQRFREASHV